MEFSPIRLALILGVAIAAHMVVLGVRALSRRALRSRIGSETKVHTVAIFASSLLVFAIYFGAVGFALSELGVPLTTYLASASVIGLAVSFGSQGLVQDVITGLTALSRVGSSWAWVHPSAIQWTTAGCQHSTRSTHPVGIDRSL